MNNEQQSQQHEAALLAHFRAHERAEPTAELDARILAAARQAALQNRGGWPQRLHHWLFGSGRQRWPAALAGLACVGLGVSLTWRSLEQTVQPFAGPPPDRSD